MIYIGILIGAILAWAVIAGINKHKRQAAQERRIEMQQHQG